LKIVFALRMESLEEPIQRKVIGDRRAESAVFGLGFCFAGRGAFRRTLLLLLLLLLACGCWKAHIVKEYGSDDNQWQLITQHCGVQNEAWDFTSEKQNGFFLQL